MRPLPDYTLDEDGMRPEYDFSGGVRGKYAARYASGPPIIVPAPDDSPPDPPSKPHDPADVSLPGDT